MRRLGSEPSVDASSEDLHSDSSQHQAECQSRRMHTQQAASTATAPLAPSTACAMLVVIRASCLAVTRRSSHLAATRIRARTYTRTYTLGHTCICTRTRTRTRTRIQARTRTHAQMPALTHLYSHCTRAAQPAAESSTASRFDRGLAQGRHRVEHSSPVRSRTRASPTQSVALLPGSAAHVQPAAAPGHYSQLSGRAQVTVQRRRRTGSELLVFIMRGKIMSENASPEA